MSITRFRCLGLSVVGVILAGTAVYQHMCGNLPLWKTVAIFVTCIAAITRSQSPLSPAAARALLKLQFDERDRRRMRDLVAKARTGELTPDNQFEADTYEQLGCLLDIIHSKARQALGRKPERLYRYSESRFMDDSATVTLAELQRDWNAWPKHEKVDFAQSFSAWGRIAEREPILRFLVAHGDHETSWPSIAQSVACEFPVVESVPILRRWCESCQVGHGANYYQAIALTGDPEAHVILSACIHRIWTTPGLMDNARFVNSIAFDAVCCLQYLLKLGEDPGQFRTAYAALTSHPCEQIRDRASRWLSEYFE